MTVYKLSHDKNKRPEIQAADKNLVVVSECRPVTAKLLPDSIGQSLATYSAAKNKP